MVATKVGKPQQSERLTQYWVGLAGVVLVTWVAVFYELPLPVGVLIFGILLVSASISYYWSTILLLLVLWIPFFSLLLIDISRALDTYRILFIPFLILSLRQKKIRNFPKSPLIFLLLLGSLILLQFSSAFQVLYRGMPLSTEQESPSMLNILAYAYDNYIILSFIYFVFTRLDLERITRLLDIIILITILQSVCILHLTALNADMLMHFRSDSILWQNPYFEHKNDWSMVFVFVILVTLIRNLYNPQHKKLYLTGLIVILAAIGVSLSRQAYVWTLMVFILSALLLRKFKILGYLMGVAVLLLIIQPDFIFARMESMVNASNQADFQNLNRKVSDLAVDQAIANFTFVPQMFLHPWEYNWSEGFWNGFLNQQGIIGLFFMLGLYFLIFKRFFYFFSFRRHPLHFVGMIGVVMIFLMFTANFTRRHTHFMHYKGEIGQIGLLAMFIISYAELLYYLLRNNKTIYDSDSSSGSA